MKDLLKRMTLREKIGQLLQLSPFFFIADLEKEASGPIRELGLDEEKIFSAGSVLGVGSPEEMIAVQKRYLEKSRLGIPLVFMADVIHGYKTIFPVPIALASSWNPETARIAARVSAEEASTSGIHMTYSPMADLVRDPRWGRVVESFGESPLLCRSFAKAMTEGYQGDDLKKGTSVASCVKHFAAYGAAEGGREYNTVDLSRQSLQDSYLEGYRGAVDAGCRGVMTAFNPFEGVPCTVNPHLLREVLRNQMGFRGITVSDYDSLHETVAHGVAEDDREAAEKGIRAGLDVEMASTCYANHLESLIRDGRIDPALLDEAVLRILELKRDLGLFENPFKGADDLAERTRVRGPEHRNASRKAAEECAVLLQNDGVLPLKEGARIAVLGPFAGARRTNGPWSWHGWEDENPSLPDVLSSRGMPPVFVKACASPDGCDDHDLDAIRRADVLLLCLGEEADESGEAHSKTDLSVPASQAEFLRLAESLGKKTVVLLQNGRPLVMENLLAADAILESWFLGTEASDVLADLLFGIVNPSGKLPMSFPRSVGQIPVHHDALPTGRPNPDELHPGEYVTKYLDSLNSPRFPFGFGLSYSRFACRNLRLSASVLSPTETLRVSLEVENAGSAAGKAVVQLYLGDPAARVSRPQRRLVAFRKTEIPAGKTAEVVFSLNVADLSYRLGDGSLVWDPGIFRVEAGEDPSRLLSAEFRLVR